MRSTRRPATWTDRPGQRCLATTTPSVVGVVNLQAQYGVSTSATSNQIIQWVDPTGTWDPATITAANRNRIKALRISVIARNAKIEPEAP